MTPPKPPVGGPASAATVPAVIRNIIFDWSGTLVDDLPAVLEATNHVLRQAGRPAMSLAEFRSEFRLPFTGFYEKHVAHVPMPQLEAWFHARFREVQESVVELPHARTFLEFCRARGLRTLLLSTVHPEHFAVQTRGNRFDAYLDHPYLGVWDKRAKIREILAAHGLDPAATVFIGDMEHDIETARHGGIRSVGVLTGYNRADQLRAARPDLIVEHLGELRERLERQQMRLHPGPDLNGHDAEPRHPVPTVGAAIFDPAGRVLMIRTHKWSGKWGIPGGKVKRGETCEAALLRELREETALEVDEVRLVLVQDCIRSEEFFRDEHFVLLNYACRTRTPGAVVLNEEAQEFRWVSLAEAFRLPLNRPTRRLLEALAAPSPAAADRITLADLEVCYRVGVPDEERARPQRLLVTVEIEADFAPAAATDDLAATINYFAVAQRLKALGEGREWRLIETLAAEIARLVVDEFGARAATAEVKKFILPETRHVSVRTRHAREAA